MLQKWEQEKGSREGRMEAGPRGRGPGGRALKTLFFKKNDYFSVIF